MPSRIPDEFGYKRIITLATNGRAELWDKAYYEWSWSRVIELSWLNSILFKP